MTKKVAASSQWAARSVRPKRSTLVAIRMADPRVDVVAALLPEARRGLGVVPDLREPLDALLAVHVRHHDPQRRAMLARDGLAVHLAGDHRVLQLELAARQLVDV